MPVRPVILCGGSGTRLWPESRESLPKQFMPIFNNKSFLDLTLERILIFNDSLQPIIICNKRHAFQVKKSIEKYNIKAKLVLEPEGKNTTAAIYIAASICSFDDILLIMPSDHLIPDTNQFYQEILNVTKLTCFNEWITLGVKPIEPSEAYGYIKVKNINEKLMNISEFVEKPPKTKAVEYLKCQNYFWNSGIFLGKASMIINSIKEHAIEIANACDNALDNKIVSSKFNEINFLSELFKDIPSISIDYAVMENDDNIKLFPLKCQWNDIGTWDTIANLDNNKNLNDNLIEIDSSGNFIRNDKRIIATIDVKDLIIIDSIDSTLIMKKQNSEKVKDIVTILKDRNKINSSEHSIEQRPWGKFEVLLNDQNCKVKKLTISPHKRLSLQYHNHRSEHWLIIKGKAHIYLDGKQIEANPGQSIDIPLQSKHYVQNKSSHELVIIETQLGSYFGEDDIVRIDDPYMR